MLLDRIVERFGENCKEGEEIVSEEFQGEEKKKGQKGREPEFVGCVQGGRKKGGGCEAFERCSGALGLV